MSSIFLKSTVPCVFAQNLPAGFKSEVWLNDLSFSTGKSYLIKSESGKGKTSFCSFISCLRSDFQGDILIDGRSVKTFSSDEKIDWVARGVSVLYQDLRLFDGLNAVENVMVKTNLTGGVHTSEVRAMLERLGIDKSMQKRPVRKLSFGQQQRVAFVRMLCAPAKFRILDEPVSHLDPVSAGIMSQMLSEQSAKDGAGVIVTSVGYDFPYDFDQILML